MEETTTSTLPLDYYKDAKQKVKESPTINSLLDGLGLEIKFDDYQRIMDINNSLVFLFDKEKPQLEIERYMTHYEMGIFTGYDLYHKETFYHVDIEYILAIIEEAIKEDYT